jgi:hypothetical protein
MSKMAARNHNGDKYQVSSLQQWQYFITPADPPHSAGRSKTGWLHFSE